MSGFYSKVGWLEESLRSLTGKQNGNLERPPVVCGETKVWPDDYSAERLGGGYLADAGSPATRVSPRVGPARMEHVFEVDPAVAEEVGEDHGAELAGELAEKGGLELLVGLTTLVRCW